MCLEHLRRQNRSKRHLYRIFYYDCPPLEKRAHNPITGKSIDLSKSPMAVWRRVFFEELRRLRKVALRLGYLDERHAGWVINPNVLKELFSKKVTFDKLTDADVKYDVRQKGVDMRIGLDIASLAYKKLVDQIVLISGDSDFVPAAKLARREGIDVILDPMWSSIRPDLHEHIDGLMTVFPNANRPDADSPPSSARSSTATPSISPKSE